MLNNTFITGQQSFKVNLSNIFVEQTDECHPSSSLYFVLLLFDIVLNFMFTKDKKKTTIVLCNFLLYCIFSVSQIATHLF